MSNVRLLLFRFLIIASFLLLTTPSKANDAIQNKFHYNETSGKCTNNDGVEGYNPVNTVNLFEKEHLIGFDSLELRKSSRKEYVNKNAECVDFHNFNFDIYIGLGYSILKNWNLRGANLNGARFHFNHIVNADLRGTQLDTFLFGYAHICGFADSFTQAQR